MKLNIKKVREDYEISVQDRIRRFTANNPYEKRYPDTSFEKKMKEIGITGGRTRLGDYTRPKADEATKLMIMTAINKLEDVNELADKKFRKWVYTLEEEGKSLAEGDSAIFEFKYTDGKGNDVTDNIGIMKKHGQICYFHEANCGPHGQPEKIFDTPSNILYGTNGNGRLAKAMRWQAKNELGIGEELYSITDANMHKIIITDPRDEVSKDGNIKRSFEKGFTDINIYKISPEEGKKLINKEELINIINENGVSVRDVNSRKAPSLQNGANLLRTYRGEMEKVNRQMQEGMDLTTSTRS